MLPQGGHFVAGSGSIGTQGLTETITQTSQRGIIDFNSFSIGKSGTVKINNGVGATLDRVNGGSLSQIMGTLSATGSVYLVNPQGVVVGKSGVITTGGSFVASSLDISNQNFMAGQSLHFEAGPNAGVVKNLGSISSSGGDVFLIARSVVNSGSINAPNGTVGLGAGQEVLLKDTSVGGGRMTVRYGAGDVRNKGSINAAQAELRAAGGNVYALAGNHSGMIRATGSATRGGHVWLTAGGSVFASGPITARNRDGSGGRVFIKAAKAAKVTGRIDVSAAAPTSARSRESGNPEAGGRVIITAQDLTLGKAAIIDASGTGDGGTVLIGGDRQGGAGASQDFAMHKIANAQTTTVEAGAQIFADGGAGGGAGTGGNVVVWSDTHTVFAGAISVRGGAQSGNGGFVETSSHGVLDFTGTADRLAPKGKAGTLLLDPENLAIVASGTSTTTQGPTGTFTANVDNSILTVADLQTALAGGSVVVQTGATPGAQAGNIDVQASLAWANANSLTLSAFNSITVESGVTLTNTAGGSVTLRADNTGIGGVSGAGLTAGFGQETFKGAGAQIKLSGGGASPGNINILYDGFSGGAFTAPINYAGSVSLAAGGKLTTFELVNNLTELQAISGALSKNYALGTSFSASGTPFTALGTAGTKFTGIFDGEGQTITGLTLSPGATKSSNLGLFGVVGTTGIVRNVTLTNVSITGTAAGDSNIGAIAGQNLGTISNVSASGTISLGSNASAIGGLVGVNSGASAKVTGSSATLGLSFGTGATQVGGLVGKNATGATVTSSSAAGTITVSAATLIGGLVGLNTRSTISSSMASGTLMASGPIVDIGGLVGANTNASTISSSTASGAVTGTGVVTAGGGLSGRNDLSSTLTGSVATGTVTVGSGSQQIGGLVGVNSSASTILSSTASGTVFSAGSVTSVGGLVGFNNITGGAGSSIKQSSALGAVIVGSGSSAVGGLVGNNNTSNTITQSFATGPVLATGSTKVGGLVGSNTGTVTNSFWDSETTGQTTGIGSGTTTGATSETTAQIQSVGAGTPFATLNSGTTVFGIVNGQSSPYLLSQFPTTPPQVVSGTAPAASAGQIVELVVNGSVAGTGVVGANGYYNVLLPSGTIAANSAVLAFLTPSANGTSNKGDGVRLAAPSAATATVNGSSVATVAESGVNIATNSVQVTTDSAATTLASSVLASAAGAIANAGILYATNAGTITFNSGVSATFTATGNGSLSIDDGLTLSGAGTLLTLNATGSVTQTGALLTPSLALAGAGGQFTLTNANNSVQVLTANLGTGNASLVKLTDSTGVTEGATGTITASTLNLSAAGAITLTNANSVGTFSANAGANAVSFTDSTGFSISGGITATGNTVTLTAGGAVTQGANTADAVSAASLSLNGAGVSFTLGNTANNVATLAANTGSVSLVDAAAGGLTIGTIGAQNGITASGVVKVTNTGAITLAKGIASQASGDAIILSAAGGLINNAGTSALTEGTGGRFLVFTPTVGDVTPGGLTANPFYGQSFASFQTNPSLIDAHAGNRFVYAQAETITVTPSSQTVTYDGAVQTAAPSFSFSGFVGTDTQANALSGSASFTGGSGRNAGAYTITSTQGSLSSDFGYGFSFGTGTLTINKESITVAAASQTRTYDGTTSSSLAPTITSGQLFGTDTAGFTQMFDSRNAGSRTLT
ncbi:MAG: filamentous hemagglutinin N-terminal domain-containing protein, partial [Hyphomicrobiales bacterium]|nr:filamentous hemagglutinin N-terminal domain-containing protein [Hyphomicrobiales bacterium]